MSGVFWLDATVFAVLGLLVGSFLNVVIYRLPNMMERQWQADYAQMNSANPNPNDSAVSPLPTGAYTHHSAAEPFNLMTPRSCCQVCGHPIRWFENIPVLSYLALRGKCSDCKTPISLRYPAIELTCAFFFAMAFFHQGTHWRAMAWAAFAAMLIVQFFIDFDTQLLPDDINYPLIWLGLSVAALGATPVSLASAVWGVMGGYLSLWLVFHVYRLLTGKEGFGYGDFKLLAGLGAWFGSEFLIAIILLSSVVGSLMGGVMLVVGKLANKDIPIAFGPYLAGAGLLIMAIGPDRVMQWAPFAFPFAVLAR